MYIGSYECLKCEKILEKLLRGSDEVAGASTRSPKLRQGLGDGHRRSGEVVGGPARSSKFMVVLRLLCNNFNKIVRVI